MNKSPSDGCNNTSVINPMPPILVVIFCICCLLSFTASAHAIDPSADEEGATDLQVRPSSLQLSIDSVLKCCTLQKQQVKNGIWIW